jgi:hypothetical protein
MNVTAEEVWDDILDLEAPVENMLEEFEEYTEDQAVHEEIIAKRFEEAMVELDTPKHR